MWINTITNTDFASDTRDFIRFRLSTTCNNLIEHLKAIAKSSNGYYGMSSKIFTDSDNRKVYDVKDGEKSITLSGGEIVREIKTANPAYTFEYLRELNNEDLIKKYFEVFSIQITKSETMQNNYNFPISIQKYKKTYYIN